MAFCYLDFGDHSKRRRDDG